MNELNSIELNAELENINLQIEALNKRKKVIEDKLCLILPFIERFKIWFHNNDKGHYDWLVGRDEYPLIRGEFDKNPDRFRRGETVDLEHLICDEVFEIWAYNQIAVYCKNEKEVEEFNNELDALLLEYQPLLEEAMEKNLKSFKVDW